MTHNVLMGNLNYAGVAANIAGECPDVVALQELSPEAAAMIGRILRKSYPHQALCPEQGYNGAGVLSRKPILEHDRFTLSPNGHMAQRLVVQLDERPLLFYNVHLLTPSLPRLFSWYNAKRRDDEAAALAARLGGENRSKVVAGDFNMTPGSSAYRRISADMLDAFCEAAGRAGRTFASPRYLGSLPLPRWPVPFLLLRLDYVFHSSDIVARRARGGIPCGSDHRPVVADLDFASDE